VPPVGHPRGTARPAEESGPHGRVHPASAIGMRRRPSGAARRLPPSRRTTSKELSRRRKSSRLLR
jgi:hypothetical protein